MFLKSNPLKLCATWQPNIPSHYNQLANKSIHINNLLQYNVQLLYAYCFCASTVAAASKAGESPLDGRHE